jgi:hypothetical protein
MNILSSRMLLLWMVTTLWWPTSRCIHCKTAQLHALHDFTKMQPALWQMLFHPTVHIKITVEFYNSLNFDRVTFLVAFVLYQRKIMTQKILLLIHYWSFLPSPSLSHFILIGRGSLTAPPPLPHQAACSLPLHTVVFISNSRCYLDM